MKLTYLRIIGTFLNQRQPQGRKWARGEITINGGSLHCAQCRMDDTVSLETSCPKKNKTVCDNVQAGFNFLVASLMGRTGPECFPELTETELHVR